MRVKNEKKSAQGTMAQKTSTQTKQLWRQFNRVNHDKMDSLWLICIVLLEEAFHLLLVEFDKSWLFLLLLLLLFKTLRVPHVLLHCQQGKVRWRTVETSGDHQRHCPCQKNPEKFTLQSALSSVLSFSLSRSFFSSKIVCCCSSGRGSAADRSLLSQSNVPTCQSAARLRDGYVDRICLGLCSPVRSWCVTFSVCKQILRLHLWRKC